MNRANALRGTWMGRTVKTEKQVLEEIAQNQEGAQVRPEPTVVGDHANGGVAKGAVSSPKDQISSMPGLEGIVHFDKSTRLGNRFSFDQLVQTTNGDFILHGLEVDEGRWEILTLCGDSKYYENNLFWREWVEISNGKGILSEGKFVHRDNLPMPLERLAPLKTVYWFMRAAHSLVMDHEDDVVGVTQRPDAAYNLAAFLRYPDERHYFNHADKFQKISNTICHTLMGWDNHPFDKQYRTFDVGKEDQFPISDSPEIVPFLATLLGDTDANRVKRVLSWVADGFMRPEITMPCSYGLQTSVSTYYARKDFAFLHGGLDITHKGPARMIRADKRYFTPRKVGP